MELVELAGLELVYTSLEALDYGGEGQLYGTIEGRLSGEPIAGALRLTNLAARRGRYRWLDTVFGLLEGVLDTVGVGGTARGVLYECRASVS